LWTNNKDNHVRYLVCGNDRFLLTGYKQQIVLAEEKQSVFQTGETVLAVKQDDFSQNINNIALNGEAKLSGTKVSLVQNVKNKAGSFFTTQKIHMASGENFGFSTYFEMETSGYDPNYGIGDGFTFIVSKKTVDLGAIAEGMGYLGLNNSLAVIFDFYDNGGQNPMSIALGVNGAITTSNTQFSSNFTGSQVWRIWIDYSQETLTLEVRVNQEDKIRPQSAFIVSGDKTVFVKWVDATPVNSFVLGIEALPELNLLTEEDNTTLTNLREQYNTLTEDQLRFLDSNYEEQLQLYEQYLALKIEIRGYVNNNLTESDYTTNNWEAIQQILRIAEDLTTSYKSIEQIAEYDLDAYKASIDAIKTIATQLEDAKVAKKLEIDAILENYNKEDYSPANWNEILQIIGDAKTAVDGLSDINDVSNSDVAEVKNDTDAVKTSTNCCTNCFRRSKD